MGQGINPAVRYEAKIDRSGGREACHPWTGKTTPARPYGQLSSTRGQRPYLPTRFGWALLYGPIPQGQCVLHRCDNPPCQNPLHWFLGTKTDNAADKVAKGRQSKGEGHGMARLTEDAVREIRALHKAGETQRDIARKFDVHYVTIHDVVCEVSWQHLL